MNDPHTQSADVKLRVFESVDQIDRAEWDALAVEPCQTHGWHRAAEEHFADTNFRYFCAYRDGRLAAALCAYDRHGPHPPTTITRLMPNSGPRVDRFCSRVLRYAPLRFLISGSPHSYVSDPIGDPAFDALLIEAMEDYARDRGVDVVSFLFHRRPVALEGAFSGPCVTDYRLELPGSSPDDYIKSFRRKHRYVRKKEVLNAGPVSWCPLAGNGETMAGLRRLTARRHGNAQDVPATYYETLGRHLGDSARIVYSKAAGVWQAALCVLVGREAITTLHVGTRGRDLRHFDVTYTAPLKLAYELGIRTLSARPSSDHTKLLRGYKPVHTGYSVKPLSLRAKALLGAIGAFRRRG